MDKSRGRVKDSLSTKTCLAGIMAVLLCRLDGTRADDNFCPDSARVGSHYTMLHEGKGLFGPLEWRAVNTNKTVACPSTGTCGQNCQVTGARHDLYQCVIHTFNPINSSSPSYAVRLILYNVTLAQDATTWGVYSNDTLLKECDLQVFSFDPEPVCTDVSVDESGTKMTWSCNVSRVHPKPRCELEYGNKNGDSIDVNEYLTVTHTATDVHYYDTQCTVRASLASMGLGKNHFKMSMYPDVADGRKYVKEVTSDELFVLGADNDDDGSGGSGGVDAPLVAGIVVAVAILVAIGFFIVGYCVGNRRTREDAIVSANKEPGDYDGVKMDNLDEGQRSAYEAVMSTTPSVRVPPNKTQKPPIQREQGGKTKGSAHPETSLTEGPTDIYMNQEELTAHLNDGVYDRPAARSRSASSVRREQRKSPKTNDNTTAQDATAATTTTTTTTTTTPAAAGIKNPRNGPAAKQSKRTNKTGVGSGLKPTGAGAGRDLIQTGKVEGPDDVYEEADVGRAIPIEEQSQGGHDDAAYDDNVYEQPVPKDGTGNDDNVYEQQLMQGGGTGNDDNVYEQQLMQGDGSGGPDDVYEQPTTEGGTEWTDEMRGDADNIYLNSQQCRDPRYFNT